MRRLLDHLGRFNVTRLETKEKMNLIDFVNMWCKYRRFLGVEIS